MTLFLVDFDGVDVDLGRDRSFGRASCWSAKFIEEKTEFKIQAFRLEWNSFLSCKYKFNGLSSIFNFYSTVYIIYEFDMYSETCIKRAPY